MTPKFRIGTVFYARDPGSKAWDRIQYESWLDLCRIMTENPKSVRRGAKLCVVEPSDWLDDVEDEE